MGRLFRVSIFATLAGLWAGRGAAHAAGADGFGPDNAVVVEMEDTALAGQIWRVLYPDSTLPAGEYQILIPSGIDPATSGPSGSVYLLRDGTQVGQIDVEAWRLLGATGTRKGWWRRNLRSADRKDAPPLWRALDADWNTWLARAEWPAGLLVSVGSALSALPGTNTQFERQIDAEWMQKMFGHALLGASLHRTQFGGGVTHNAAVREARQTGAAAPDFWGDAWWWWSVSAGLPFVRYTAYLANRPLPRYFWLETRADSLIRYHRPGKVVKQWDAFSISPQGNIAHTLDFRLSHFRYALNFDGDAYAKPVHDIRVDEMPAFFGNWGAGFLVAGSAAASRLWLDIPDLGFTLPFPENRPSDFRLAFLRLDFAYRNLRSFSLGLAVTVRINNLIFNLPGA